MNYSELSEAEIAAFVTGANAEKQDEERRKADQVPGVPIAFFNTPGTYRIRLWPDRDKDGRIRVIRFCRFHQIEGLPRFVHDERVNKLAFIADGDNPDKVKIADAWKWKSRANGFMMAHIYESPESNKYVKDGTDVCLILNNRKRVQFREFIASQRPTTLLKILNPSTPAPALLVTLTGVRTEQLMNISFDGIDDVLMPSQPQFEDPETTWSSLDDVYVRETDRISDEHFDKFKGIFGEAMERATLRASGAEDPSRQQPRNNEMSESQRQWVDGPNPNERQERAPEPVASQPVASIDDLTGNGPSGPTAENTAVQEAQAQSDAKCLIRQMAGTRPGVAEKYPNATFGNFPGDNDFCSICDEVVTCREESQKKVASDYGSETPPW